MLSATEATLDTGVAVALALALLLTRLRRTRPQLRLAGPLALGFGLRLAVIAGVGLTGLGHTLYGEDEQGFLHTAHELVTLSVFSGRWLPTAQPSYLHILVFAAQIKLLGSPEGALRIAQVGISLAGAVLIATAVHDLTGPRPARLTMWLLSLELSSLFFDELLHKEALMELATGLVVLGAVKVWDRLQYRGVALMAAGCLIAIGTREYVGWSLAACAVMISLHAAVRHLDRGLKVVPIVWGTLVVVLIALPVVLRVTSPQSLRANLQQSQEANASAVSGDGSANGNNLALPPVDFSTRGAIAVNLPSRMSDILLRPYPWEVGDLSQAFGVLGSVEALATYVLLLLAAWRGGVAALRRAAPVLYPLGFLWVAYALSVGNAGTGFRYRTHLLTLVLAGFVVMRAAAPERRHQPAAVPLVTLTAGPA